jgi:hypothetical protein
MKWKLLLFFCNIFYCNAQVKENISISSDFGELKIEKLCKKENNLTTIFFQYKAVFYFKDDHTNDIHDEIRIKVKINEVGEIYEYEIEKQPVCLDFYRTINNFFKDIIKNKNSTGNKNLSCENKITQYSFTFKT